MKTYKQFVEGCGCPHSKKKKKTENVTEVVALAPLAIPVGKAIGAGLAATGLTGMIMQARKQGEGKRSQPVDYGQGGTATPRDKSVQRPTGRRPRATYRERMRARQRQRAQEVQQNKTGGTQHGPSFNKDAAEAAKRREQNRMTPDQRLDKLIDKAARELGIKLPEENKLGEGMLPVPSMARRLMNNPPIPQQQDKEDKYEKRFKSYDKKISNLKKELKASNKHRDEKLNYQYKDVTNPKRPSDPVKDLKKKGTA